MRRRRHLVAGDPRGLTCWYYENGHLKNIVHHTAVRSRSDYFSFREDGTLLRHDLRAGGLLMGEVWQLG